MHGCRHTQQPPQETGLAAHAWTLDAGGGAVQRLSKASIDLRLGLGLLKDSGFGKAIEQYAQRQRRMIFRVQR